MSSTDIAISVRNLTKTYRLFGHPGDRIKQFFSLGLKQYHREFTALKDVSFDIRKGETVGIIGRNGSGKSTLLQLICGIFNPTSSTVQGYRRISGRLELAREVHHTVPVCVDGKVAIALSVLIPRPAAPVIVKPYLPMPVKVPRHYSIWLAHRAYVPGGARFPRDA
jgi:ABC-type ATPase with predicted acetyltransferase domain